MPTTYKGSTVPVATDLADGPDAFRDLLDTLATSEAVDAVADSVLFRVFTTDTALQAWAAPLGARANRIVHVGGVDVVVPYTRAPGLAFAPTWFPHLTGVWAGSSASTGRVNYAVPWPIDPPDTGGNVVWKMIHSVEGIAVRFDMTEFDALGFRWNTVSGFVTEVSWQVGIYQSFD